MDWIIKDDLFGSYEKHEFDKIKVIYEVRKKKDGCEESVIKINGPSNIRLYHFKDIQYIRDIINLVEEKALELNWEYSK